MAEEAKLGHPPVYYLLILLQLVVWYTGDVHLIQEQFFTKKLTSPRSANIAPTILEYLDLPKPNEIHASSLKA